jgi:hypothetical protein
MLAFAFTFAHCSKFSWMETKVNESSGVKLVRAMEFIEPVVLCKSTLSHHSVIDKVYMLIQALSQPPDSSVNARAAIEVAPTTYTIQIFPTLEQRSRP